MNFWEGSAVKDLRKSRRIQCTPNDHDYNHIKFPFEHSIPTLQKRWRLFRWSRRFCCHVVIDEYQTCDIYWKSLISCETANCGHLTSFHFILFHFIRVIIPPWIEHGAMPLNQFAIVIHLQSIGRTATSGTYIIYSTERQIYYICISFTTLQESHSGHDS
jgi:hypothetical protein